MIAGIVVGAVFALALITSLALWAGWRHRRRNGHGVREIDPDIGRASRPPLPPKEKRSSYGYYDLDKKNGGAIVDTGRVTSQLGHDDGDVEMGDLKQQPSVHTRRMEERTGLEQEMSTPDEPERHEIYELPTSPTGAASEMATPHHRTLASRGGPEVKTDPDER